MIKIEVTGNSIPEVADKLLAIGASLQGITTTMPVEVAEAAPAPKPKASSTKSSTPVEITSNGHPNNRDTLEETKSSDLSSPTSAPKSAPAAEVTESQPTTEEPVSAPVLDFEKQVAPIVLQFVQKRSKEETSAILAEFGVERASMLDPTLWPELVARLQAEML